MFKHIALAGLLTVTPGDTRLAKNHRGRGIKVKTGVKGGGLTSNHNRASLTLA